MKPGCATQSYSPSICRVTKGVKQWHYYSVPLHNAAQTHQLFQSQLELWHGTAWHCIDMSLHHSFSCDCNVPAGFLELHIWGASSKHILRRAPLVSQTEGTSTSRGLGHIYSVYHPHCEKLPNPNAKAMKKTLGMEERGGHKIRQSLDTAPNHCSLWSTKSQEEMLCYDLSYRTGWLSAGQGAFHALQIQSDTSRTLQPQSNQSTLAF